MRTDIAGPEPPESDLVARPWPVRRRRVIGGVIVVVLVVVGGLAARGGWSGAGRVTRLSPDEAPFSYPGEDRVGAPAPVGFALSFGSLVLVNTTDEPITITGARVLDVDDGAHVLGVLLDASQDRKSIAIGALPLFPATNPGSVFQDPPVVVEPASAAPRGVDVVVGLTPMRPGVGHARGIEISYRRGGRNYVTTYNNSFHVCTDLTQTCKDDQTTDL